MSAWQQSVSSVSQLSCNMTVQLRYVSSAQLLSEGSVATRQVSCQLSCDLSAQIKLVISPATGWLSRSLSPLLCSVFSVAVCQLSCNMSCSHRSAESQEHNPDPGPDPGLTRVRFKPSMTASLNEDLEKQLYHDLTQGISRVRGLVQSPVSRYFTITIMQNTLLRCNAPALQGWYDGQCQPALQTSCRPQEAWQRL